MRSTLVAVFGLGLLFVSASAALPLASHSRVALVSVGSVAAFIANYWPVVPPRELSVLAEQQLATAVDPLQPSPAASECSESKQAVARLLRAAELASPFEPLYRFRRTAAEARDAGLAACSESNSTLQSAAVLLPNPDSVERDASAAYSAGLHELTLGRRERAFPLFKRASELSLNFNEEHRQALFALMRSGEDIRQTLPETFPQILYWLEHFSQNKPELLELWQESFSDGLQACLSRLPAQVAESRTSQASALQYVRRVSALSLVSHSETLRGRLDNILADLVAGQDAPFAAYRRERARAVRVPALYAWAGNRRDAPESIPYAWYAPDAAPPAALMRFGPRIALYFPERARALPKETTALFVIEGARHQVAGEAPQLSFLAGSASGGGLSPWNACKLRGMHQFAATELVYECAVESLPEIVAVQVTGAASNFRLENQLGRLVQVYVQR